MVMEIRHPGEVLLHLVTHIAPLVPELGGHYRLIFVIRLASLCFIIVTGFFKAIDTHRINFSQNIAMLSIRTGGKHFRGDKHEQRRNISWITR